MFPCVGASATYSHNLDCLKTQIPGGYAPDYSQPCPVGWTAGVATDCIAPASYTGPCVLKKSFLSYGESDKASRGTLPYLDLQLQNTMTC